METSRKTRKILYGVQGTGNGHIARAIDFIPELSKHAEVDVLLSGLDYDLQFPFDIKYTCKGLGFLFGRNGGIDYLKSVRSLKIRNFFKDIRSIDTSEYDLIISDFEPISAWAAKRTNTPSIAIGNQPALLSPKTPRPRRKEFFAELVLKYYAPAPNHIAFCFDRYDASIYPPTVRSDIRKAKITNDGHYTIYLPAYSDKKIIEMLSNFPAIDWEVFSKYTRKDYTVANIVMRRIDPKLFTASLASCEGIICNSGFTTPTEAMFMHKKLMVIPMDQYEQKCNAVALKRLGVPVLKKFNRAHLSTIKEWIDNPISYDHDKLSYSSSAEAVKQIIQLME